MSTISVRDIEALMEQFRRGEWREMHLRLGDTELFLSADGEARLPDRTPVSTPAMRASNAVVAVPPSSAVAAASPTPPLPATSGPGAVIPTGWVQVRAPSLGSFYRAPKPGAPAFAEVGARVTPDSELCVIEVMKLFTTMRAGVAGTVRDVYAQDGELVEFDQPLFLIEPHA